MLMTLRSVPTWHQALLALALIPLSAVASKFTSITPSPDTLGMKSQLTIATSDGRRFQAPKARGQVGYTNSYVSPDGKYAGWLVEYPQPGEPKHPIPGPLVVMDQSLKLHYFSGKNPQAIFEWCFVSKVGAVAYLSGPLHFGNEANFVLRRISDGKTLATFYLPNQTNSQRAASIRHAPAWVRCVARQEAANSGAAGLH